VLAKGLSSVFWPDRDKELLRGLLQQIAPEDGML